MKHRKNMRTFKLGGKLKVQAKMSDAKEEVLLPITRENIINGVPGSAWLCVGAQCMIGSGKLFPFPAEAVQFTKSRAYAIAKSNARTNSFRALRYEHDYSDFVKLFDKFRKMTNEEKISRVEAMFDGKMVLRLRPPHEKLGTDTISHGGRPRSQKNRNRTPFRTPTGRVSEPRGPESRTIARYEFEAQQKLAELTQR